MLVDRDRAAAAYPGLGTEITRAEVVDHSFREPDLPERPDFAKLAFDPVRSAVDRIENNT
jgi:hypothetical protein